MSLSWSTRPAGRLLFGAIVIVTALLTTLTGLLQTPNRFFYDQILSHSRQAVPNDIVIIAIDRYSLDRLGRWPWRRARHAELLERITPTTARAVALNILFAEPDVDHPGDDALLADAIRANGRTFLPLLVESDASGARLRETQPLPLLKEAAAGLGHVDAEFDSDGVVRSVFLKAGLGRPVWPALALAMLQFGETSDNSAALPGERYAQIEESANWVRDHRVLIPFSGPPGHITQRSFADVLAGKVPASDFADKFVFIGATATGTGDTLATPVSLQGQPMSGVEFNAQLLNGLLHQSLIVPLSRHAELALNLSFALLGALLFSMLGNRQLVPALLLSGLSIALLCYLLLTRFHTWYPPAGALFTLLLAFGLFTWQQFRSLLGSLFDERTGNRLLLTSIGDAVIRTDHQGRVLELNAPALQLCGFSTEEVTGRRLDEIVSLRERDGGKNFPLNSLLSGQFLHSTEPLMLTSLKGRNVPVQIAATPAPAQDPERSGVIVVITDISTEEQLFATIAHRENHDTLTRLPNRPHVLLKLEQALRRAERNGQQLIVLDIDIDHFQQINQTFGEAVGDKVLKTLAGRLSVMDRYGKTVGRIGGDEFVVIMEGEESSAVPRISNAIKQSIADKIVLSGHELCLTATIGVSVFPDWGGSAEVLLRQANSALHQAKLRGGNQLELFSENMQGELDRRAQIRQALDGALDQSRIETHYLPLVRASDLAVIGVETLLRLRDNAGNYLAAEEFVPLAEESGALAEMGYRQFSEACYQQRLWMKSGLPPLRLACNLSSGQIRDPQLAATLESIVRSTGINPALVEFEITEQLVMSHDQVVIPVLQQLRAFGAGVSIDDFGTSTSSMGYLMNFPFQRLKIDRLFVQEIGIKPGSSAITSAIISMANSLNMKVTAEGVENSAQYEVLRQQGCHDLQGFYFGEPFSAEAFHHYFTANRGVAPVLEATNVDS